MKPLAPLPDEYLALLEGELDVEETLAMAEWLLSHPKDFAMYKRMEAAYEEIRRLNQPSKPAPVEMSQWGIRTWPANSFSPLRIAAGIDTSQTALDRMAIELHKACTLSAEAPAGSARATLTPFERPAQPIHGTLTRDKFRFQRVPAGRYWLEFFR
jgi:anti-sigma factor RsiW